MGEMSTLKGESHRGANGDMKVFAPRFLRARMEGFAKDIAICLTGVPSENRDGKTHAYFPALMSCLGTLEYMTQLYLGRMDACGEPEFKQYCEKFMPTSYDADVRRVLIYAFRHTVAHRGICSGVWVDKNRSRPQRRITWKVTEKSQAPAVSILPHISVIKRDTPWECPTTHRAVIHIAQLAVDIRVSVLGEQGYAAALSNSDRLIRNFTDCMKEMYPA